MSTASAFSGDTYTTRAMPVDRLTRFVREVEPVDALEERGERLARTGRRGDERVVARGDARPTVALRWRRPFGEAATEPGADRGVEPVDARQRGTERQLAGMIFDGGHVESVTNICSGSH